MRRAQEKMDRWIAYVQDWTPSYAIGMFYAGLFAERCIRSCLYDTSFVIASVCSITSRLKLTSDATKRVNANLQCAVTAQDWTHAASVGGDSAASRCGAFTRRRRPFHSWAA